ncbi:hypothetical protein AXF42_Ash009228 [Apostasia shenzhenica]|uniref:Uncharacterized protein n=1 Tax=Apostasia shenzhenica TaxID=1088818 RepID=A0A2I0B3H6_9ASPA|nr:hypothetical protein AXF42_Ash009228 [Apostasia shenzhenica]
MSFGCVSFFGPLGPPRLQVVGERIGIMGWANPALPLSECWIGKFGRLSRSLSRYHRAVLATVTGASHRIEVLKNYLLVPSKSSECILDIFRATGIPGTRIVSVMSPGRVSFFGPSVPPRLHVVGDRIKITGRANPALPSRECWIGKFGLLLRSLSRCHRAVLVTATGASRQSEFWRNTCIVSVMSSRRVNIFGPSGPPGLHVVGDFIGIMHRANPVLPSCQCWIGKFGLL